MAIQKITADVISSDAITTASISDSAITAAKLAGTLDLTGKTITVATASSGDNDTSPASTAFVQQEISALVDSSPDALNTLNELAAALGDDANFSTTVTNSIALKAPLASPDFTGDVTFDTSTLVVDSTNNRVGIGTSTVSDPLHIKATRAIIRLEPTAVGGTTFVMRNGVFGGSEGGLSFYDVTNSSTRLVIDSSGKVHIGGTSGTGILNVDGGTGEGSLYVEGTYSGSPITARLLASDGGAVFFGSSSNHDLRIQTNGTNRMTIDTSGNISMGGNLSITGTLNTSSSVTMNKSVASGNFLTDATIYPLRLTNDDTTAGNAIALTFGQGGFDFTNFIASVRTGTGNDPKGDLVFGGRPSDGNAFVERMRIQASGQVGIGTTNPTQKLEVSPDSDIQAIIGRARIGDLGYDDFAGFGHVDTGVQYAILQHYTGETYVNAASGYPINFRINNAQVGMFKSGGNFGVGSTNPQTKIHVFGTNPVIRISDDGTSGYSTLELRQQNTTTEGFEAMYNSGTGHTHLNNVYSGGDLVFATATGSFGTTSTNERMRILSGGDVCIGKPSNDINTQGWHVIGAGTYSGTVYSGITGAIVSTTYHLRDTTNNTWKFYVENSGTVKATVTSIASLSDERLKENIKDLETGLTEVMSLKPRRFDWKEGEGSNRKNVAGFVAQEVETVLPDVLEGFMHDDLDDAKSVRMGDMLPTLVKAIQEQQTLIESLTARIETLEG